MCGRRELKKEALGSPLLQQRGEVASFLVTRELDEDRYTTEGSFKFLPFLE